MDLEIPSSQSNASHQTKSYFGPEGLVFTQLFLYRCCVHFQIRKYLSEDGSCSWKMSIESIIVVASALIAHCVWKPISMLLLWLLLLCAHHIGICLQLEEERKRLQSRGVALWRCVAPKMLKFQQRKIVKVFHVVGASRCTAFLICAAQPVLAQEQSCKD